MSALSNRNEGEEKGEGEYDELVCRICHDSEVNELLVAPCKCKGTQGLVHLSCLHRWLLEARRTRCEVCGARYDARRRLRRGAALSLLAWFCVPRSWTRPRLLYRRENRALVAEIAVAVAAGLLLLAGAWASLVLADNYSSRLIRLSTTGHVVSAPFKMGALVISSLLIILVVGSVICFSSWVMFLVRKHSFTWYFWWQHDILLTVVAEPMTVSAYRRSLRADRESGPTEQGPLPPPPPSPTTPSRSLPRGSAITTTGSRHDTVWEDLTRAVSLYTVGLSSEKDN